MTFVDWLYVLLSAVLFVWAMAIQPQQDNPRVNTKVLLVFTLFLVVMALTVFRVTL